VGTPFLPVFLVGAGLLALWIDVRHPKLAPDSLSKRLVAAGCGVLALQLVPVFHGSVLAVYATLFGIVLPVLVTSLLAAVWLMRALQEANHLR
jgi:hypothetical protein